MRRRTGPLPRRISTLSRLNDSRADDLAAYADAVWWLGRIEDNLRLGAAAYNAFLADSRPAEAALTATVLGIFHTARGDEPQAVGWLGRAGRLAEDIPESTAHGYLVNFTVVEASLMAGQPAAAVDAARRVQDLGRRIARPIWSRWASTARAAP